MLSIRPMSIWIDHKSQRTGNAGQEENKIHVKFRRSPEAIAEKMPE